MDLQAYRLTFSKNEFRFIGKSVLIVVLFRVVNLMVY